MGAEFRHEAYRECDPNQPAIHRWVCTCDQLATRWTLYTDPRAAPSVIRHAHHANRAASTRGNAGDEP